MDARQEEIDISQVIAHLILRCSHIDDDKIIFDRKDFWSDVESSIKYKQDKGEE